ncbi:glycosyltransferase family 4 protein [Candidatus Woesebacteria bacterium]|nr:glycosyltransferase family 4 protein [Candidatus Woesebacteria bacterium]
MKIVIDARLYGLENTGIGRYTINLISQLQKIDSANEYTVLLRKKYFDQINLPNNWKKVLADYPHYSFSEQFRLPFLLYSLKPDLVHFLHLNVPILYWQKYVLTVHDILISTQTGTDTTTLPFYWYWIKRLVLPAVFINALKMSQKILVPSETVKSEICRIYSIKPSKIVVTYEGVDTKLNTNSKHISTEEKYFLYIGNAYPHKNLVKAIEALLILNKTSRVEYKLFIVSARSVFTERLMNSIKLLGAENIVEITGYVTDEKLSSLYKNSQAFLFPSLSEGFGLPGLEALSSGTLLLASEIPVFREIYSGHAVYFDPRDASSIKEAMLNSINMNEKDREEKIKAGQVFSNKYSWSKTAQETLRVYEEVNENRGRNYV